MNRYTKRAFTLIELLVVISIIGLLLAILIPGLNKAKQQTQMVICASNQHQILTAVQTYAAENKQKLPRGNWTMTPHYLISEYLKYLPEYDIFKCPMAPFKADDIFLTTSMTFQDLYAMDNAWTRNDGLICSYWLLWNYKGWEQVGFSPINEGEHTLMISDVAIYWEAAGTPTGVDEWFFNHRCRGASKSPPTSPLFQLFWRFEDSNKPKIQQNGGYFDGHVKRTSVLNWASFNQGNLNVYFPKEWN